MGKYDEVLRPFVAMMEKELYANAGKGDRPGWLQMDGKTAILEVFYHMGKLHQAVHRGEAEAIKEYAADVANMCMMLVDVCGLLSVDEQPEPVAAERPPALCRQRLAAKGKPYPRSSCSVCGQFAPKSRECDALIEAEGLQK